jgi:chlorobactene glucosyltransferase
MLFYQGIITFLLLAMACMTLYNMRRLATIPVRSAEPDAPFVSVLVPARNEENSIRACVESLLAQRYTHYEVLVLNDNSTDATGGILHELSLQHPGKLRVLDGQPLPADWVGKNWACDQLYRAASGDLLLFTDADTIHRPESLASAVAFLREQQADALSIIPEEKTGTLAEQLVIPLIHLAFLSFLPIRQSMTNPRLPVGAANGQFMLFRREVYERVGGHRALRANIVEDVFFSRRLKQFGSFILVADATHLVSCRMYHSFREVWAGFSKNMYPAMAARPVMIVLFLLMHIALYILPLAFVVQAVLTGNVTAAGFGLPLGQFALATAMRFAVSQRFRLPLGQAFLQPLSSVLGMAICINSVHWYYSGGGMQWKGRRYDSSLIAPE